VLCALIITMKILVPLALILIVASGCKTPRAGKLAKPIYENDFTAANAGQVPEDLLVLDGGFAVKEEGGNKFLELPGAPLETFGVVFGPTETNGLAVTARIQGTGKGRRFPTFGVGLNGVGGYKLQVAPAKKIVELYRGDNVLTNAPWTWETGSWLLMRLQSRPMGDAVRVEAKVWKQGDPEPKAWQISYLDGGAPPGRASIWGMPFAGTPLRFDDLTVTRAK
jgi:hypothetical protein